MRNQKLLTTVECAMMVALALVLNFIIVWQMPQGGSVTACAMLPIILISLRRGSIAGIICGVVFGLLQFILKPISYNVWSIFLDYIVAFGVLGVVGFAKKDSNVSIIIFTIFAILLRFLSHIISGATVFSEYAEGANPWVYSFSYNITYMGPELVITTIVVGILISIKKLNMFLVK